VPELIIPLVGQQTRRGLAFTASSTKDQYFGGCVFSIESNEYTGSKNVYVEKRPGISSAVIAAGSRGAAISPSGVVKAYGAAPSTIYYDFTSVGAASDTCFQITETLISGVTFYLITAIDGTGWFLAGDSMADLSFTGDTHTNTTIDNIVGSGGVYVGQLISGTGIQAGTRVATRTPDTTTPTSITTTIATTATNAGVTITKEPLAKIISAGFPTVKNFSRLASMDGYVFAMTESGRIYQSDLNSVTSWDANNYISADISPDIALDILAYKNHIICFGGSSLEFFYNAGNPSGSVLSSRKELFKNIGIDAGAVPPITITNDNVFWIGNDGNVYTFAGLEPKNLSKQGMNIGSNTAQPESISSFRIGVDTIVHLPSTTAVENDRWYSLYTDAWINPAMTIARTRFANLYNKAISLVASGVSFDSTSGKSYLIKPTLYQDDGAAFTMTIQTEPKVLNKGKGFTIKSVELLADNQSSGSTSLKISGDDYANFTTIGNFDLTATRKKLFRCGYYKNHAIFKLEDSGNNAWRGQALIVNWEPCNT
jgi:hypothetical protein